MPVRPILAARYLLITKCRSLFFGCQEPMAASTFEVCVSLLGHPQDELLSLQGICIASVSPSLCKKAGATGRQGLLQTESQQNGQGSASATDCIAT